MNKRLLFLSFIEGATVMAVELCGARLLAPVFGSSLYVWASVLGVTLIALAAGYFVGGWWSSKVLNTQKKLNQLLILASFSVLLMPFTAQYLITRIAYFPFFPALLCSTVLMLFPSVFLLGASSPLFINIQSKDKSDAGKVSGSIYAISTFGGILATFLCGFYLLPHLGLNLTLLFFGTLLFVVTAVCLRTGSFSPSAIMVSFIVLAVLPELQKPKSLYVSEGIMGRVEVQDVIRENSTIRLLKVNDIVQSEMNCSTKQSVSAYVKVFDTLCIAYPEHSKALVLGLGAGFTSNCLIKRKFDVKAVEFDERVIYAAKTYFDLNTGVKTVDCDARRYINITSEKHDIILVDVFKAEEQPSHVLTTESLNKLKTLMNQRAKLIINWHGYSTGRLGEGTSILFNTLIDQGFYVKCCATSQDENHRNLLFVATLEKMPVPAFEVSLKPDSFAGLATDDRPLLDHANAQANLAWRKLYLAHYTGRKQSE